MIKKFITALSNPPQTISGCQGRANHEWQAKIEAIGSLRAVKGADLSLELSGVVKSISFNSGDDIAEGAPLLKLRVPPTMSPGLKSLQAMAALSEITYERDQKQFKMQAVSQGDFGYRRRQSEERPGPGGPTASHYREEILCARRSPATSASVPSISDNISEARTVIVTLQALDPIFVDFFVPQQSVDQVRLGLHGPRSRSTLSRNRPSPARYRRSIRRWIPAAATSRSGRR